MPVDADVLRFIKLIPRQLSYFDIYLGCTKLTIPFPIPPLCLLLTFTHPFHISNPAVSHVPNLKTSFQCGVKRPPQYKFKTVQVQI